MATTYLSPGVYIEEVDRGSKPIEGVGTAVAAFVGFAAEGPIGAPTLVTNWSQYQEQFGGFVDGAFLPHAVYGYFNNGGGIAYITRLPGEFKTDESAKATPAELPAPAIALPGRMAKPQPTLELTAKKPSDGDVTVEVQPPDENAPDDQFSMTITQGEQQETYKNLTFGSARGANNVLDSVNQSKLVAAADKAASGSLAERAPALGSYTLARPENTALAVHVDQLPAITAAEIIGDVDARTGVLGLEVADTVTMVAVPDLMSAYLANRISEEDVRAVQTAMMNHCEAMRDRVAILDAPPNMSPQQIRTWRQDTANYDSKYAVLYYPWVRVANPMGDGSVLVPPSGHMAGIWARSDGERGVHKAPANEPVRGAIGLETQLTRGEQDTLNPIGVNCIRAFAGRGIRVWGARTLSSDPAWRYLNVRRLFNYVEKSIDNGTQWVVFEPNDADLWGRIKRDVGAFLDLCWMSGALFGATARESYFVKCDEELNPVSVRDIGQVIIEIGIAPVKPAEFVIFRISQYSPAAA